MTIGVVTRSTGSRYLVRCLPDAEQGDSIITIECQAKGSLRIDKEIRSTQPVAVGDVVDVADGYIVKIHERKNYVVRRATNLSKQTHILAANVDRALLVVTVARPVTSTTFIDRFLASCEAYGVPAALAFNKTDSLTEQDIIEQQRLMHIYEQAGYPCFAISALWGKLPQTLLHLFKDKTTLLSGHSGVGKSTLLNTLVPNAAQATSAISDAYDSGRHTTSYSQMFMLPNGGDIIDTPGIKGFGMFDMRNGEIGHYFPEMFRISKDCRFHNCTHQHEPDCAVVKAVEDGRIAVSRYASYISILADSSARKYR